MQAYDIRVSDRARAMRVAVHPGGAVIVTVPRRASKGAVDRFLARYAVWIERARAKSAQARVITAEKRLLTVYKKEAKAVAEKWCAHYARRYGVSYRHITIRAQKSRWGSCSRAGNLSFNYKIALLPEAVVRYVIVHEICHLIHFDHSRAFWQAVEREVPTHRELRRELRAVAFRFT